MKKTLAVLLIIVALFISGCETMYGLGRDLENAGNWLQRQSG